jgi:hypothetical protein
MKNNQTAEDSVAATELKQIETQTEATEEQSLVEPEKGEESLEDEVVITIAGESPPPEEEEKQAPEWVRSLRKSYRELQREKRELEEKLKSVSPSPEQRPADPGKKPTLEQCDYDSDKFENELASWFDRRRQAEDVTAKQVAQQQAEQESWKKKLEGYNTAKIGLKVSDFSEAEESVLENLDVTQQGIILQGAQNPAVLVYALGKNAKKAKELGEIKDPVKFAFAVAKLETQLTVTSRKQLPPPEKKLNGTGTVTTTNAQLERLREEAARTGDMTRVVAYKRQLKSQ